MKKQFEKVKKLAEKLHSESRKFDEMIDEKWGFNYSDFDFDFAIDSLDYGTGDISFKEFVRVMDEEKKERDLQ